MGSVSHRPVVAHREIPEMRARMATADLRKAEMVDLRVRVGKAIQSATNRWSLKELAAKLEDAGHKRDPRQIARWRSGQERPQLDVLFAVEELRQPLVVALAELAGDSVEIETTLRLRRPA